MAPLYSNSTSEEGEADLKLEETQNDKQSEKIPFDDGKDLKKDGWSNLKDHNKGSQPTQEIEGNLEPNNTSDDIPQTAPVIDSKPEPPLEKEEITTEAAKIPDDDEEDKTSPTATSEGGLVKLPSVLPSTPLPIPTQAVTKKKASSPKGPPIAGIVLPSAASPDHRISGASPSSIGDPKVVLPVETHGTSPAAIIVPIILVLGLVGAVAFFMVRRNRKKFLARRSFRGSYRKAAESVALTQSDSPPQTVDAMYAKVDMSKKKSASTPTNEEECSLMQSISNGNYLGPVPEADFVGNDDVFKDTLSEADFVDSDDVFKNTPSEGDFVGNGDVFKDSPSKPDKKSMDGMSAVTGSDSGEASGPGVTLVENDLYGPAQKVLKPSDGSEKAGGSINKIDINKDNAKSDSDTEQAGDRVYFDYDVAARLSRDLDDDAPPPLPSLLPEDSDNVYDPVEPEGAVGGEPEQNQGSDQQEESAYLSPKCHDHKIADGEWKPFHDYDAVYQPSKRNSANKTSNPNDKFVIDSQNYIEGKRRSTSTVTNPYEEISFSDDKVDPAENIYSTIPDGGGGLSSRPGQATSGLGKVKDVDSSAPTSPAPPPPRPRSMQPSGAPLLRPRRPITAPPGGSDEQPRATKRNTALTPIPSLSNITDTTEEQQGRGDSFYDPVELDVEKVIPPSVTDLKDEDEDENIYEAYEPAVQNNDQNKNVPDKKPK